MNSAIPQKASATAKGAPELPRRLKQTDIGLMPEDWSVPQLQELAADGYPIRYGIVQVGSYLEAGVPVLAIKNLNSDYETDVHRTSVEVDKAYARSRVRPTDVLISIKGTTGRIGIVPQHFEGNISRDLARIRPRDNVSPDYIFQALQCGFIQRRLNTAAVGTTRMELSISTLREFRIPLPPTRTEQDAIARVLGDCDLFIFQLFHLIAKKRQTLQGTEAEFLTGKRRLPGFVGNWKETLVEGVINRYFCGPSPTCLERNIASDEEWGVLKTTAVTWEHGWDWTKHKVLPRAFWNKPHIAVNAGDVIVTKAGPRHRVGVAVWVDSVPPRIIVSGKMMALRPSPGKAIPLMLAAAIAAPEAQLFLDQRTTGMAESQVNFENDVLLKTPIKMPEIDEQKAIACVISEMKDEIVALEHELSKAREIKQGMMQELLTGKVRLV